VPNGKATDFRKAVQAKDDETVVFSWIEWPDKQTRDAAHAKMLQARAPGDKVARGGQRAGSECAGRRARAS
jgi:uncharacterized protein YbaA (DUF1428 family)